MKLSIGLEFEIDFQPSGKLFLEVYDTGGNSLGSKAVSIKEVYGYSLEIYPLKSEQKKMLKNIRKAVEKL